MHAETQSGALTGNWLKNLASVVFVLRLWPVFWLQFGMIGGLYSFMGLWGITYLRGVHGLDKSSTASHMTTMLLAYAVGALFFGWFSDRIGRRKPILIACVLGYTLSWLILMYVPWSPGVNSLMLFGFMGFAGTFRLRETYCRNIFMTNT